jgi:hypothetical protein
LAASPNPTEWGKEGSTHFLYACTSIFYFFKARLHRHLPELAIFIACLLVHIWRRGYMQWPFAIIASFATLFIGFLIPHRNYFYTPLWYFSSFLVVFLTVRAAWCAVAVPAVVLVLFIPQYGGVRRGAQIRGTGRTTAGGAIGHSEPRHRLDPCDHLWRLHILAGV